MKRKVFIMFLLACLVMTGCAASTTEGNGESVDSGEIEDSVSVFGTVGEMTTETSSELKNTAGAISADMGAIELQEESDDDSEDKSEYKHEKDEDEEENNESNSLEDFVDIESSYLLSKDGTQLVFELKYISGLPYRWTYSIDAPTVIKCSSSEHIYDEKSIDDSVNDNVESEELGVSIDKAAVRVGGAGIWRAVFDGGKVGQTVIHLYFGSQAPDMGPILTYDITVTVNEAGKITVDKIVEK